MNTSLSSFACSSRTLTALLTLGALAQGACAHSPPPKPIKPEFSAEQVRARSGRWGGPEVTLGADAMAYAAGTASEVTQWSATLGHAPLVVVEPLKDQTHEAIDAAAYTRALTQALTNGGHFEVAQSDAAPAAVDGHVRSQLVSEPLQVEGQRATVYTLQLELVDREAKPVWQRHEVIRKWAAPSPGAEDPPKLLPPPGSSSAP